MTKCKGINTEQTSLAISLKFLQDDIGTTLEAKAWTYVEMFGHMQA